MTESQAATAHTRKRVLLVDDDPGTLHVLSRGLGTVLDMFDVVTAHNGREAIEVLQSQSVDALVTDLAMPVMDGFALIAYVTTMRRVLPLVVLSGMASGEVDERLSAHGSLRVLRKPASYQDVADQLLKAMEHAALGQIEGIPLAGVLQLVEAERRSCTVVVTSGRRKGRLHFQSGRLIDAFSEDFGADGEAAAYDILGWNDTSIAFEHLPDDARRTVHTPMQLMLIELAVTQDRLRADAARAGEPPPPNDAETPAGTPDDAPMGDATEPPGAVEAHVDAHEGMTFEPDDDHGEALHDEVEPAFGDLPVDADGAMPRYADGNDMPPSYDEVPVDAPPAADAATAAHQADEALPTHVAPALGTPRHAHDETIAAHEPHVASLLSAVERLAERVRSANDALAAVDAEVATVLESQRALDAALSSNERRQRELEAFRDEVAGLAQQILQRVDAMRSATRPDAPSSQGAPADDTEAHSAT